MNPYEIFKEDIDNCLRVLYEGGLILYPTDTVWGLGCDATDKEAVEKIYNLKRREDTRAMLVLMENENQLNYYLEEVPVIAWELIEVTDKPLTLIYPGAKNFAPNLPGDDGSIGIRITREDFTVQLLRRFRKPIVSTSANISGNITPENFYEIKPEIITSVDYVVKYRQDDMSKAKPSSIIKVGKGGQIRILRK